MDAKYDWSDVVAEIVNIAGTATSGKFILATGRFENSADAGGFSVNVQFIYIHPSGNIVDIFGYQGDTLLNLCTKMIRLDLETPHFYIFSNATFDYENFEDPSSIDYINTLFTLTIPYGYKQFI